MNNVGSTKVYVKRGCEKKKQRLKLIHSVLGSETEVWRKKYFREESGPGWKGEEERQRNSRQGKLPVL